MSYRGHSHRHVESFECDIAVTLAKGRLRLENRRINHALYDNFRIRRHIEADADATHDRNRPSGKTACDRHLVEINGKLLRASELDHWGRADDNGDLHRLLQLAIFEPMNVAAGAARTRHPAHGAAARCPKLGALRGPMSA